MSAVCCSNVLLRTYSCILYVSPFYSKREAYVLSIASTHSFKVSMRSSVFFSLSVFRGGVACMCDVCVCANMCIFGCCVCVVCGACVCIHVCA